LPCIIVVKKEVFAMKKRIIKQVAGMGLATIVFVSAWGGLVQTIVADEYVDSVIQYYTGITPMDFPNILVD